MRHQPMIDRGGPLLLEAAARVDACAPEPVLVYGSRPDDARDLDLLVRPTTLSALTTGLTEAGFEHIGDEWILVEGTAAVAVDVTEAGEWALPAPALAELFAAARPIAGYEHLLHPAPHHDLLVLARRLARSPGVLDGRRRARVEAATVEDPTAWERAGALAPEWGCVRALAVLRRAAVQGDGRVHRTGALAVRVEEQRRAGSSLPLAAARAAASFLAGPHGGAVVSLSGIDGAGKSTQAGLVADGLAAVGHDVVVEWSRITFGKPLQVIARPVKAILALRVPGASKPPSGDTDPEHGAGDEEPVSAVDAKARELRDRSRLIGSIWAGVVATTNALSLRRNTRRHLRAGHVVVRDRYVLDSVVQLEWAYARGRDLAWQGRVIRFLVPPAVASFFLDVPPEDAHARKPEEYDIDDLRLHRDTYLRHVGPLGAVVVDGARPPEAIFDEVLRTTLRRLAARRRS